MRHFLRATKGAPHPELVEGRMIVMQIGESAQSEIGVEHDVTSTIRSKEEGSLS
jgi:hypothetical protein